MGEWMTAPLGSLLANGEVSYGIVQPGNDVADGVPIARVKDLRNRRIDESNPMRVAPAVSDRHSRTVLQGGELLMSVVGTVGETAVVPDRLAGWNVARAIAVLKPTKVSAQWLQLALQTKSVQGEIQGVLNTTVQSTLNLADLKRLSIPVPPEAEQRSIAEVLGALDDKIAANDRIAHLCVEAADVYYQRQQAGTNETVRLGDVATLVLGGTPSRSKPEYWTNGTVPWVASGKANEDRVLEPTEWITTEALEKSAAKMMPTNATVLAITGATLGQVARLEIEASGNQSLIGIWHCDAAINDWIYFAVCHEIDELLKHATGAAQQHVNKAAVAALEIPMPQHGKVAAWGALVRPLLDRAASADAESLRLAATRDELLPLLMSGKIRVQDAEYVNGDSL